MGVGVVNVGSDSGQLLPMAEQIEQRYEQRPERMLADGDFAKLDDIETLHTKHEIDVYSPVKKLDSGTGQGERPVSAEAEGRAGRGEVVDAHGHGRCENDLSTACPDSGVGQCSRAEHGAARISGEWLGESTH